MLTPDFSSPRTEPNAGIYVIRLSDRHYYGGRSVDVRKRARTHLRELRAGKHKNTHMQRVFDQHREFDIEVVMPLLSSEDQKVMEQYWLDVNVGVPGCVNLAPTSITPEHRVPHTPEAKAKIGAANKARPGNDDRLRAMAERQRGVPLTESHREKLCLKSRGWAPEVRARAVIKNTGVKRSPEACEKMRAARLAYLARKEQP